MTEKFIAAAADLFPFYPTINTFFFTADCYAFIKEETANKHAAKLEDKTVTPVSREDVPKPAEAAPVITAPADEAPAEHND